MIKLQYQDLDLQVDGVCHQHQYWNGQITWIKLHDPVCSLASGFKPGMTVQEVLERFPFADETGYMITGIYQAGQAILKINVLDNRVDSLELTWAAN